MYIKNVLRFLNSSITLKTYGLICIVLCSLIILWLHQLNRDQNSLNRSNLVDQTRREDALILKILNPSNPNSYSRTRKILYWTKMFQSDNFYFGDGDIFAACPVWNCIATNDRTIEDVTEFDAIMFHGPEIDILDLPRKRYSRQRYIFVDLETPIYHPIQNREIYKNFFNWSMTYRRDSSLMRPYGIVRNVRTNEVIPPHIPAMWKDVSKGKISEKSRDIVKSKTRQIAWFVSNCKTLSRREDYVDVLKQYVDVDVFGSCSNFSCDTRLGAECYKMVERKYYFYLAFENSLCKDYVTEKAFKFLEYDVVPIVYGAVDYAGVLPPHSYIDIMDFKSPKTLASFLWELSYDSERYLEYFRWKDMYKVQTIPNEHTLCELCQKLHVEPRLPEVIEDVYKWWTKEQCWRFDGTILGIN
ncbi:alpha-(1,3)-fucosyltransferase C-like [Cephus cinctus]|uniref:Fucosyltransferase n=1 Tax=Cephus cinctus TaxID=211228 RepID=A0AAJ7FFB0_CEPCN|nr:alpha-(1,3)-fucosyltransferase C-like [Cephus cinctus]